MGETFRASMNWLHTWAGVLLGGVLFAIFWMGTLSVFDREIDLWMMPASRLEFAEPRSYDAISAALQPLVHGAQQWYVTPPTNRDPTMRVGYRMPGQPFENRAVDPATSALLPDGGTWAGTRFIFPFHFSLHIRIWTLGYWIVGLAGMAMLALCVSGIVVHRRFFTDFFTFRVRTRPGRFLLDVHNVSGVLGLPFHLVITLSGLIIFFTIYLSPALDLAYRGDRAAFNREAFGTFSRKSAGQPGGPTTSIDLIMRQAPQLWQGARPNFVRLWHPGDANAYVELRRSYEDGVTMIVDVAFFDATSGALLHRATAGPVLNVQRFVSGLHFIQFGHWTLRWIYFALGLAGCATIATGYLFWLESRHKKHEQLRLGGVRFVEGLTIGSVSGIVIATLVLLRRQSPAAARRDVCRSTIVRRWRSGPSISCGSRPSPMPGCGRAVRGASNAGPSPFSPRPPCC